MLIIIQFIALFNLFSVSRAALCGTFTLNSGCARCEEKCADGSLIKYCVPSNCPAAPLYLTDWAWGYTECSADPPYVSFDFRYKPPRQGGSATKQFMLDVQGSLGNDIFTGTSATTPDGVLQCKQDHFVFIHQLGTNIPPTSPKTLNVLVELTSTGQTPAGIFSIVYDHMSAQFDAITFDTPYFKSGSDNDYRTQDIATSIASMDDDKWRWITLVDAPPRVKLYVNGELIQSFQYDPSHNQGFGSHSVLLLCAQTQDNQHQGLNLANANILYAELRLDAPTLHQPYCFCNQAKSIASKASNMVCTDAAPTPPPTPAPTPSPIEPYLTDWAWGYKECSTDPPYVSFDFRYKPPRQGGSATKQFMLDVQGSLGNDIFTGTSASTPDGVLQCKQDHFVFIHQLGTNIPPASPKVLNVLVELTSTGQTPAGIFGLVYDHVSAQFDAITFDTPYFKSGSDNDYRTQDMATSVPSMDDDKWRWITLVDAPPYIKLYINGELIQSFQYDPSHNQDFGSHSVLLLCAQTQDNQHKGLNLANANILYAELRLQEPKPSDPYCFCNQAKSIASKASDMICKETFDPTQPCRPQGRTCTNSNSNRYAMVSGISHFTMWNGQTHQYDGESLLTPSNNIHNELGFYYMHECKETDDMPFRLIGWHVYKENWVSSKWLHNTLTLSVLNRISLELKPLKSETHIKNKYVHFAFDKYEITTNDATKASTRFSSSASTWSNTDITVTVGSMTYKIQLRTGAQGKREVYLNIGHGAATTDDFSFKFKRENRGAYATNARGVVRPKQNQLLFYAAPPTCYRCLTCGILGDFDNTDKKTFDKQGNVIPIVHNTNWAQDWTFEPARRRLSGLILKRRLSGLHAQNELAGLCNDDMDVYDGIVSSCKAFFESNDIVECCTKISAICVDKQKSCEFDSCIEYNTDDYVDYDDVTDAILKVSMAGICDEANILSFVDPDHAIVNDIEPVISTDDDEEDDKKIDELLNTTHELLIVVIVLVIVIVVMIVGFCIWFCYCRKGKYQPVATVSTDDDRQEL